MAVHVNVYVHTHTHIQTYIRTHMNWGINPGYRRVFHLLQIISGNSMFFFNIVSSRSSRLAGQICRLVYTTHNTQHTTHNTQHTTHNTQHRLFIPHWFACGPPPPPSPNIHTYTYTSTKAYICLFRICMYTPTRTYSFILYLRTFIHEFASAIFKIFVSTIIYLFINLFIY